MYAFRYLFLSVFSYCVRPFSLPIVVVYLLMAFGVSFFMIVRVLVPPSFIGSVIC